MSKATTKDTTKATTKDTTATAEEAAKQSALADKKTPVAKLLKGEKESVIYVNPDEITLVNSEYLKRRGIASHWAYQDRADNKPNREMVENIKEYGVMLPSYVKREHGETIVFVGRQRLINLRAANAELIAAGEAPLLYPVLYREADDEVTQRGQVISENFQRKAVDVVSAAEELAAFLSSNGNNRKLAQTAFGVTNMTLTNWLKVHALALEVKQLIKSNAISPQAAIDHFSKMPLVEQIEAAKKFDAALATAPETSVATAGTTPVRDASKVNSTGPKSSRAKNGKQKPASTTAVAKALGKNTPSGKNGTKKAAGRKAEVRRMIEQSQVLKDAFRTILMWAEDMITTEEASVQLPWLPKAIAE